MKVACMNQPASGPGEMSNWNLDLHVAKPLVLLIGSLSSTVWAHDKCMRRSLQGTNLNVDDTFQPHPNVAQEEG